MNVTIDTIKTCFDELVGFTQITDPCTQSEVGFLDSTLTASDSGLYFDTFCEDVNHEMMLAFAPDFKTNTWSTWAIGTSYAIGDAVQYAGVVYKSLANANIGNQPDITPLSWEVVFASLPSYTSWLANEKDQTLTAMMHEWSKARGTKSPLAFTTLYMGSAYKQDTFIPTDNFRGYRLNHVSHTGLRLRISKIGLQLQNLQPAPVTIYIYHESSNSPMFTTTLTGLNNGDMQWVTVNLVLPFWSDAINSQGGSWYVGYYDSDITVGNVIYNKRVNVSSLNVSGCQTCGNDTNKKNFEMYRPFVMASTIQVQNSYLNGTDLFDVHGVREIGATNNGMNIEFSVECDTTYFACQQKQAFAELYQMGFNVRMLKKIETNPNARSNQFADSKNAIRERVIFLLYGDDKTKGLVDVYKEKLEKLILDTEGMHSGCLPTFADKNVRYTSV